MQQLLLLRPGPSSPCAHMAGSANKNHDQYFMATVAILILTSHTSAAACLTITQIHSRAVPSGHSHLLLVASRMRTSLLMSSTGPGMAFKPASRSETMPVAFQFSERLVSADLPQQLPIGGLLSQLGTGRVLVTTGGLCGMAAAPTDCVPIECKTCS